MVITIITSNYISEWAAGNTPPPNILWNALLVLCQKLRSEIESGFLLLAHLLGKEENDKLQRVFSLCSSKFPRAAPTSKLRILPIV